MLGAHTSPAPGPTTHQLSRLPPLLPPPHLPCLLSSARFPSLRRLPSLSLLPPPPPPRKQFLPPPPSVPPLPAATSRSLPRERGRKPSDQETTVSRCTIKKAQGTHAFEIVDYTLQKGIGVGNFVRSGTFTVGGYDWAIRFYPDGFTDYTKGRAAVYLELMNEDAEVRALYDLRLVNQASGSKESISSETDPTALGSSNGGTTPALIERSNLELESAGYIVDDCLTIECHLTVVGSAKVSKANGGLGIEVPPSELSENFGKLLFDEETADVVFIVEGEIFPAHKLVLAARSPVFKAEFHGQMKERTEQCVTVEDVKPDVFKALLYFAYTDLMPEWGDLSDDEYIETVRHLLVAADRYAMDRLKLLCASILLDYLDAENVATTLALADQSNCPSLMDVCIEFMASIDQMDTVVATQGYADLKRNHPSVLVDVLERTSKFRKTYMD
ncbi:hypothetical protein EJB05_09064, partial [Eragrostis curvula]